MKKNLLLSTCILFITLFATFSNADAGENLFSKMSETQQNRAQLFEKKFNELLVKRNLTKDQGIKYIDHFIDMKDLSDSDVLMLQYIIFQLSKTNTEIVEKYSNESGLVHHGKNSTKESILTYRLHHNYRENYLKHKEEDILSSYIYKKEDSEKVVYLTFDDGPYKNQKPLVNYIFEQEIPSTFFLLCNKINSKNIQSYKKDFVSVGMHTYTHLNYDNLTRFAIEKDVSRCVETFNKYDLETRIFRPAFGIVNRDESEVLGNNNIEGIVWSMDSLDWEGVFNDSRIDEMLDSVTPGEIILLHENANLEMFKKLVEGLKKKGYSFGLL